MLCSNLGYISPLFLDYYVTVLLLIWTPLAIYRAYIYSINALKYFVIWIEITLYILFPVWLTPGPLSYCYHFSISYNEANFRCRLGKEF